MALTTEILIKAKDASKAVLDKVADNIKGAGDAADKSAKSTDNLGKSVSKLSKEEQKLEIEQKKLKNSTEQISIEQEKLDRSTKELNTAYQQATTEEQKAAISKKQLANSAKQLSLDNKKLSIEQKELGLSTKKVSSEEKELGLSSKKLSVEQKELGVTARKLSNEQKELGIKARKLSIEQRELSLSSKKLSNEQKKVSISAKKAAIEQKKIAASAKAAAAEQKKLERNTRSLDGTFKSLTSRVIAFGAAYLGLRKLKEGFLSILETGGRFETMKVQLNGLMGTVEGGEQAFAWIKEFTKNTPLQLDGVTKAFVKMKAFGLDPMDGTMQKLTDISSRLGGGQERLEGIILAVGQAWTRGKLQAEEANQLIERGVPVWDLMSKAIGRTTGELQDMARKGQLGREEMKLLIDEIGKSSEGAAAAQMTTWAGIISNLGDTWTTFLSSIAESGVLDYFKEQLTDLSATIKEMAADGSLKEWAVSISEGIISLSKTVKSVVTTIYEYKDAIVAMAVAQAGVKFAGFLAGFVGVTAATKTATVATRGFTAALSVNPISLFVAGLLTIVPSIVAVIESYKEKAAAEKDLVLAETELLDSSEKIRLSILARIEADKLAKEESKDYLSRINTAIAKGNEQAEQQAYLSSELGKSTEAAIALSAAQEGLADKTGDTSKAIAKLSNVEIDGLIKKIDDVNSTDLFVGGGWNELRGNLLHEKFKRIGIDLDIIRGNATKVGVDGSKAFIDFANSAGATKESIARLAEKLIDAAKTKGDIDALKQSFREVGFEVSYHPKLIQAIIEKIIELGGSLDDIPQKWKDIADAYDNTKEQIKVGNRELIESENSRHQNRIDNIQTEHEFWIAAKDAEIALQEKADAEKEERRLASTFRAFSESQSEAFGGLDDISLALFKKAEQAASANISGAGSFDRDEYIKRLLAQQKQREEGSSQNIFQQAIETQREKIEFTFKSNLSGEQATLLASSQQEVDNLIDILKTEGSVT